MNLEVDFLGRAPDELAGGQGPGGHARTQEPIHHKKFRFTLTTNGMLLDDEVTAFCNREMHNVVLSLTAGRRSTTGCGRTWPGWGSYDIIVPKFQRFVQQRGDQSYYMRGTFTHDKWTLPTTFSTWPIWALPS